MNIKFRAWPLSFVLAKWWLATSAQAVTLPDPVVPDWMTSAQLGEQIQHNGVEMKIVYFRTNKNVQQVLDHYESAWSKAEHPPVQSDVAGWKVVGYQEGDYYHTVQVRPSATGVSSEGMVAVTALPSTRPSFESSLPRLPNSLLLSVTNSVDNGKDAQTIVLENESSLKSNLDFYLSQMAHEGWSIQQNVDADRSLQDTKRVLLMTRGNLICQLTILHVASGKTHVVANITTDHR